MKIDLAISGLLPDWDKKTFYPAKVIVNQGIIQSIKAISASESKQGSPLPYVIPGFIDSHVHIESSMLVPAEFARLAVVHGTVASVSDPHEIANVCGMEGIKFMIENGSQVPFKFFFGAPSCVPATHFESAGSALGPAQVTELLEDERIRYLSEMMNYPGVLKKDPEVMAKIHAAQIQGKPIDGHAPGLTGALAKQYADAGISTDHECFTMEEALGKLQFGMKILIREGSAAKNFEALIELLHEHADEIMFCSDDKHPDSLLLGHINELCARAVQMGHDVFNVIKAACINPVLHYNLPVGQLRIGDPADFVLVKDLRTFTILKTYIDGILVADQGLSKIGRNPTTIINRFNIGKKDLKDFVFSDDDIFVDVDGNISVIEALDGQLITNRLYYPANLVRLGKGQWTSNTRDDILKIVVVNRYKEAPIAKAYIKNFSLNAGALASSVAHDSHNIVAIGVDDESICAAVNLIIEESGGISFVQKSDDDQVDCKELIPLPVGGLMSDDDGYAIACAYEALDARVKLAGCSLSSPFMTLSFMALLVIPSLKLSDLGLFDADNFCLIR